MNNKEQILSFCERHGNREAVLMIDNDNYQINLEGVLAIGNDHTGEKTCVSIDCAKSGENLRYFEIYFCRVRDVQMFTECLKLTMENDDIVYIYLHK